MAGLSILLLFLSLIFLMVSVQLLQGKSGALIRQHLEKAEDPAAYARAWGFCVFTMSAASVVSGILCFSTGLVAIAIYVLLGGALISIAMICGVLIKHRKKSGK